MIINMYIFDNIISVLYIVYKLVFKIFFDVIFIFLFFVIKKYIKNKMFLMCDCLVFVL